jgi:hypothetical protein
MMATSECYFASDMTWNWQAASAILNKLITVDRAGTGLGYACRPSQSLLPPCPAQKQFQGFYCHVPLEKRWWSLFGRPPPPHKDTACTFRVWIRVRHYIPRIFAVVRELIAHADLDGCPCINVLWFFRSFLLVIMHKAGFFFMKREKNWGARPHDGVSVWKTQAPLSAIMVHVWWNTAWLF